MSAGAHNAAGLAEGGGLLTITISAGKGNVLSLAVMNDVRKALAAHKDEKALRMALITATGPHFSYGASVEEHTRDHVDVMLPAFHAMIRDVALFPVPVAALVRGRCMGGAFELALACHFVLAAEGALFSCPEIKLGVFPPVLAALGPHRLGGALAERLLLTGDDLRADDAMRAGFVAAVFPEAADPIESALVWYRARLGALSGSSIRFATKAARVAGGLVDRLGASLDFAERLYLDELANTHDGNEGIDAFLAQRRPAWSHA